MTSPGEFTDDDLKRLKEMLYHKCEGDDVPPPFPFNGSPIEKMKALLARLSEAEARIKELDNINDDLQRKYTEKALEYSEALNRIKELETLGDEMVKHLNGYMNLKNVWASLRQKEGGKLCGKYQERFV